MNLILPGISVDIDTPFHSLDPRAKILGWMLLLSSIFLCRNPFAVSLVFISFISVALVSRVPLFPLFLTLKATASISVFLAVFSLFLTPGASVFNWFLFNITREGIVVALSQVWGISMAVLVTGVFSFSTSPSSMAAGIEALLRPLTRLGFPSAEIGMILTIAFRFVPVFIDEIQIITKAQYARGAGRFKRSFPGKLKAAVAMFVPLMLQAVKRAEELAEAMEARGYVPGEKRTRLKPLSFGLRDLAACLLVLLWFFLFLVVSFSTANAV